MTAAGGARRRAWSHRLALAAGGLAVAACASGGTGSGAAPTGSIGAPATGVVESGAPSTAATSATAATPSGSAESTPGDLVVGGDRPVTIQVPPDTGPANPAPLLVYLHGFTASSGDLERWLPLGAEALARGMVVALPEGSRDARGDRFWNATDACCDLLGAGTDDSAYLAGVIAEIAAKVPIDPRRIYIAGHSNGAFMSYRMACDHADTIAAIVSIAGATWADPARCQPSAPVSILQIHGTDDDVIRFDGGTITAGGAAGGGAVPVAYPGARQSIATWNDYDGCRDEGTNQATMLDLEATLSGPDGPAETTVQTFDDGCAAGGHTELWWVMGASHAPTFTAEAPARIVDFLLSRSKP